MDTITKQLADALRDAIGDCHEVINSRVQSLGENYRPHVLAAMRKAVAEKESILAAYDIQPLQQARQPLTPREIELIDGMIEVQRHHANQCDTMAARPGGNKVMAEKQKAWDMERIALLEKLKEPPA